MLIKEFGDGYRIDIAKTKIVSENETPLGRTAAEILEMVQSYASDGEVFFRKGDLVNAAAAFAYGYGWLCAGKYLGYLSGQKSFELSNLAEKIPENLSEHLTEKTHRYQRMLKLALASVKILPDEETVLFHAAEYMLAETKQYFDLGSVTLSEFDELNALIFFSYGYGWLDAGVRSGIFGVFQNRDLFTI